MRLPRLSGLNPIITAALLALATGVVGAVLGSWNADREMSVKMVEIAVNILSQEPKENIAPARKWAVDVISYYADVKPSEEVKNALVNYNVVKSSWCDDVFSSNCFILDNSKLDLLKKALPKSDPEVIVPPDPNAK